MKHAAILLLVALVGCSTSEPVVTPTPKGASLDTVGAGLDQIDAAVAASIQVAREMNKASKPDKVESELSVAAANLPAPDAASIALARQRAETATPSEYESHRAKAKANASEMERAWLDLEGQVRDNKKAMREKDVQIKELKAQVADAKKDIWTVTGAGLVVIGGLAMAFASWKMGAPLLLAGAFCGAIPFIVDSPMFIWISAATLASCAGLGVWWVFDKVRDNINESEKTEEKVQDR
jgi:hypothetical protein